MNQHFEVVQKTEPSGTELLLVGVPALPADHSRSETTMTSPITAPMPLRYGRFFRGFELFTRLYKTFGPRCFKGFYDDKNKNNLKKKTFTYKSAFACDKVSELLYYINEYWNKEQYCRLIYKITGQFQVSQNFGFGGNPV